MQADPTGTDHSVHRRPQTAARASGRQDGSLAQAARQGTAGIQSALASEAMVRGLGWLSVGLGLTALLAPRELGSYTGLKGRTALLRVTGARELLSGLGLLTRPENCGWIWARVLGDLIDLAVLAGASGRSSRGRGRALASLGVVSAITAFDLGTAVQRTRLKSSGARAPDIYLERSLLINKSPAECYAFWRDISNLARFTARVVSITALDERRARWIVALPGQRQLQWDSELTVEVPGQRIQWRALSGAPFQHAGAVVFEAAPGKRGTLVKVSMHYKAPGGSIGAGLVQWLGPDPFGEVRENLRRFKQLIETGEIPTTEGQPAGQRSLMGRWLPKALRRLRPHPARAGRERMHSQPHDPAQPEARP